MNVWLGHRKPALSIGIGERIWKDGSNLSPLFAMHWMDENLKLLMPSPWREAVLGLLAVVAGLVIGNERTQKEKPAGLRTMALVCLGSATFTMIGFAFTSATGDSGRVAAQIVTGIGFLGGGVIMRGQNSIFGATTAAMIWVTAAIGMVIGAGFPVAGFGVTVAVLTMLKFVGRWEHTHQGGGRSETVNVDIRTRARQKPDQARKTHGGL
jgi:putative Mg2+ transporter-C (MgtC) family protein